MNPLTLKQIYDVSGEEGQCPGLIKLVIVHPRSTGGRTQAG